MSGPTEIPTLRARLETGPHRDTRLLQYGVKYELSRRPDCDHDQVHYGIRVCPNYHQTSWSDGSILYLCNLLLALIQHPLMQL